MATHYYAKSLVFIATTLFVGCMDGRVSNLPIDSFTATQIGATTNCNFYQNSPGHKIFGIGTALAELQPRYELAVADDEDSDSIDALHYNYELILYMGMQPSGGYKITLSHISPVVIDGEATVFVDIRIPEKNTVQTQAMTSPCVALHLSGGSYKTVNFKDQNGHILVNVNTKD